MTTLTDRDLADTYKDLLQVSNSNAGINTTLTAIEDGEGTASKLKLSTAAIKAETVPLLPFGDSTKLTNGGAGILLPFYVYPNNPYSDATVTALLGLIRKYRDIPFIIVINPSSGPGTVWDGNYAAFITVLKAAGATVCGYVSTTYAGTISPFRTEAQVKADIDGWQTIYATTPISGIFLDEMSYEASASNIALYKEYTDYSHSRNLYPVIGNPGTNSLGAYESTRTSDIIVVHESTKWADTATMEAAMLGPYVDQHIDYNYALRAALIYGATAPLDAFFYRRLARAVRWIYVTDDVLSPNPWDSVSGLLEELCAILADKGTPGRGYTVLTYSATPAWDAGETDTAYLALTGNATVATPTNLLRGRRYRLVAKQDATGSRTLNFSAGYKVEAAITLPLTATANKTHVIDFLYDGTSMLATNVALFS